MSIVGDAFVDVVVGGVVRLPEWGADALTEEPIQFTPGGSATNTTLQLAALLQLLPQPAADPQLVLHTALGQDFFGSFMRSKIAQAVGGNDRLLRVSTAPSSSATKQSTGVCVCLSGAADRAFITHRGVVATFDRPQLDVPLLLESQVVHIAGFYNCPSLWPALPALLRDCQAKGIVTSLSPQYDASEAWGGLQDILPHLDIFIPNELEALAISRQPDVPSATRFFVGCGIKHVVVTLGPKGAYALVENGTRELRQACPIKQVVDTTGAGDAFNAGLLYSLVGELMMDRRGGEEEEEKEVGAWQAALRWGVAMGAHSVTKVGASAPPHGKEEILQNLNEMNDHP